jgi:excisionase family DNA binding protein
MTPESDLAKPQFLTVSEVSGELSVGESLVLELIRSGELPAQRLPSRRLRIERHMFEHWLQDQYAVTRRWILEHPR